MAGRPTKFTAGRIAVILATLRTGASRAAAAAAAEIDYSTFYDWVHWDETHDGPLTLPEDVTPPPFEDGDEPDIYPRGTTFPEALTRAEHEAEEDLVRAIKRAGTKDAKITYQYDRQGNLLREVHEYDWRAAAWLLEHSPKQREKWKGSQALEVSGPDGGPVKTSVTFTPDAAFMARVAKLADEVLPDDPEDEDTGA